MKVYLVTGGAGFIGSNYIHYLFQNETDFEVINFDKLTYAGNLENLKDIENKENYSFIKGDICDKVLLKEIFKNNKVDYVVHFAAESHVDRSLREPEVFAATNIMGTLNLLNAAKEAWKADDGYMEGKRYLQVSTDEVYGSLSDADNFFYESTALDPHSPYSASKASADLLVKSYIDTFQFPANITRCSNNYGPYQFPEKLIPLMIHNALEGKRLPVYGDGKNVRDWLYVMDHAKAIQMVLKKGKLGEVYNIGGHNEKKNLDIVTIIINTLVSLLPDIDSRKTRINSNLITYIEDRKGHDRRYAIAPDKIKNEIGWFPETKFEDGIIRTVKWYLQNSDWMERVTSGAYQKYYKEYYKES